MSGYTTDTFLMLPYMSQNPILFSFLSFICFEMIKLANLRLKKNKVLKGPEMLCKTIHTHKKFHMALFCDNNFKQFWKLLHSRAVFQRIGLPVFNFCISGVLPYVDWVLTSFSFPNEAKVTSLKH